MYGLRRAQSSLEYLLLIGGVVLIAAVVMLVIFTNVIPAGEGILQNNLVQSGNEITASGYKCGNGSLDAGEACDPVGFACVNGNACQNNCSCGSPPSAYGGPISLDWGTIAHTDYAELVSTAQKSVSGFKIKNDGTSPIVIEKISVFYSFASPHPALYLPLPSSLSTLSFRDSFSANVLTLNNVASGSIITLMNPITLGAGEEWTGSLVFNQPIFPIYQVDAGGGVFHYFPAAGSHFMQVQFTDDAGALHRPPSLNDFLSYEKGDGLGGLDPYINVCNAGASIPSGDVFGVATDLCDGEPCAYTKDFGYSTVFQFPFPLPVSFDTIHSQFFATQDNAIVVGAGQYGDADPYSFVKGGVSCDPIIFDDVEETGNTPGITASPVDADGVFPEVKYFDVDGLISPGEDRVFFSLVGADSPSYGMDSQGWRWWRSGHYLGPVDGYPFPFFLFRYSVPG